MSRPIRNARGAPYPDPLRAARLAAAAGADGITAHLREDRRHISDGDIDNLARELTIPLNLEMAATEEMLEIALRHKPHAVCSFPRSARSARRRAASTRRPSTII
jgi:pyridoxine 5-phosphate synthase